MSTPHNEANLGDIAKTVIMPGDPLRAKYIAENFLDEYKLVNSVRGMYAYTGKYKGKQGQNSPGLANRRNLQIWFIHSGGKVGGILPKGRLCL